MKKTKQISLLVLGVALSLALAGCAKEADKGSVNPTFDEKTQTVKTDFVLSISTNTGKDTKTTAAMAQVGDDAKFLGMDQVHLLAYKLDDSNKSADHGYFFFNPVVGGNPVPALRDYDLGTLLSAGSVTKDQASRSVELAVPLGTNAVTFYGKATKLYDSYLQGSTITKGDVSDMTSLKFSLEPLLTSMDAFDVGAFFFSRMFTFLCSSGLVDEATFWSPAGSDDKSYGLWWPQPTEEDKAQLPENPEDQTKVVIGPIEYTYYHGQLSWKQLGLQYFYFIDKVPATDPDAIIKTDKNKPFTLKPLGEAMGEAYYVITTIKAQGSYEELRAGSASAILMMIEDLHSIVERCMNAEATSWEEEVTRLLAEEVHSNLRLFFDEDNGKLDFIKKDGEYDVATLKTRIEKATTPTDWGTIKEKAAKLTMDQLIAYFQDIPNGNYGFPVNVGLPFGAAIVDCAADMTQQNIRDSFSYKKDIPAYGFEKASFNISNYCYPPELMYYGNSSIRTNVEAKTSNQYPSSVDAWDSEGQQWSGWTKNGTVSSSTRSVAMVNNINYGTALLRSNVKYSSGLTNLEDNNAALHEGEENHLIPVNAGDGFLVTGIIVGGQAEVVGWDYTRRPDGGAYAGMSYSETDKKFSGVTFDDNGFDKMVYDRVINGYKIGESTTPIYTMLWDNYNHLKAADDQDDVYIGIEIYNLTGYDFWGEMNLVRNGGVFYLLGKMKLADAVAAARDTEKGGAEEAFSDLNRTYYCYPPFNPANGKTINAPRVFMQDYMTTANLVLNKDCLKHAYVTLPDLRSSQISLGVSVDMTWEPGLAFEVIMGQVN